MACDKHGPVRIFHECNALAVDSTEVISKCLTMRTMPYVFPFLEIFLWNNSMAITMPAAPARPAITKY